MIRKVIQLAAKTLVVSLPSKWVKKQGMHKGDEVEVSEHLRGLLISGRGEAGASKISVDLSGLDERVVKWVVSALHKKGYDEIELFYDNPAIAKVIHDRVKNLMLGFTVASQSEKRCVLKSVSKEIEAEFDLSLRRAWLVSLELANNSLKIIESQHLSGLAELTELESSNNQLTNFCERILNKSEYREPDKTHFIYAVVWNLEKVCDDYKYICDYLAKEETVSIGNDVLEVYKKANLLFKGYYELFYDFELKKLNELNKVRNSLNAEIKNLLATKGKRELIVVSYLSSLTAKLADFSASMIALNVR
jgi:phosphate uptake regulator